MSVLSIYDHFSFAILPCSILIAKETIIRQSMAWNRHLDIDRIVSRDIRIILNSPDGPLRLPSVKTGILLNQTDGPCGPRTLFVSNVADGFSSMIYMLSEAISGSHVLIQSSRTSCKYPRNSFSVIESGLLVRTVYSMLDTNGWQFFEKGNPVYFEDIINYRNRRKRDRLNNEIISDYLRNLGYGSLDEDFWISNEPSHLICESDFRLGS